MICCSECFNDIEIKSAIENLSRKGDCPICKSKNTWIYNSKIDGFNTDIEEQLGSIISIYKPIPEEQLSDDKIEHCNLEECLSRDWKIFKVNTEGIRSIVSGILENSFSLNSNILDQPVYVPELYSNEYLEQNSALKTYTWNEFKKYMRNENRFHNKHINFNVLYEILKNAEVIIKAESKLYRARISDKKGYKNEDMYAPPDDLASSGRANSKGQSCLYLCSKKDTTLKEIRASVFDYVTISTFTITRDLKILDLTSITHNSPFYSNSNKINFLLNEKHLNDIEKDLSKPMSRRDSELDYLPTQYISDYARFCGYDGVKYQSTFDNEAYNLAIFKKDVCRCSYTRNYYIKNSKYDFVLA